jgi:hypothetical protein
VVPTRLRWAGDLVRFAPTATTSRSKAGHLRGADLETTGLRPGTARPARSAVRARLELTDRFQTLATRAPLQRGGRAHGFARRGASPRATGRRRIIVPSGSGDAVLVAHNARFDMAFLDNETMRLTGNRVADRRRHRRLRPARLPRPPALPSSALAPLRHRARPCHRALPDAEATAEILVRLIGMAQERGAQTVADSSACRDASR